MIGQIEDVHILREPESAYSVHLGGEKVDLSLDNTVCFDINTGESICYWFPALGAKLGFVIAAAMMINLLAAGLSGALIPLTLQRIHIDPALASGTILTTVTDVVGFFAFLGLATVFLL